MRLCAVPRSSDSRLTTRYSENVQDVRELLRKAHSVAVLTGAGVSAESNIPTFRGNGGLWKQFRAEDLATPKAFASDPRLVWEWYDWRRQLIAQAQPNPGHYALAELESRIRRFELITQNVDGLHDRAGSRRILKVHGDIWTLRCVDCGADNIDRRAPLPELPPRCACGGLLRPGVVWFGEALPQDVWRQAEQAARSAEVFLIAGTSALVYPAASLIDVAKQSGAKVIEINIASSSVSHDVDEFLQGASGELLPQLIA
jgi:NAD-dependent deacetylase